MVLLLRQQVAVLRDTLIHGLLPEEMLRLLTISRQEIILSRLLIQEDVQ